MSSAGRSASRSSRRSPPAAPRSPRAATPPSPPPLSAAHCSSPSPPTRFHRCAPHPPRTSRSTKTREMSPSTPPIDHRRAAAQRSIEAILDAAEQLLAKGADTSTSAVAATAGVSRVTLYSHFPTRPDLLQAVAVRAVSRGAQAIAAADLTSGEPDDALDRLVVAAWGKLDLKVFAAARGELTAEALRRAHEQIDAPILALIRRGRRAGAFRKDVPISWQLATFYALMHTAADEVNAGRLAGREALPALRSTIRAAFRAGNGAQR